MRDFQRLPDAALLRLDEIIAPIGPLPWRRTKFLLLVQLGEAPAPVVRGHRATLWTWRSIREYLERVAGGVPE